MQTSETNAKRRYTRGVMGIMLAYAGLLFSSQHIVHRWHPAGWHLYLAAAMPTIPILGLAVIVGRYLREEKDEFQRDIVVRGLLWGTAVALSLTVFSGFLRSFGINAQLPAFSEIIAFWTTVAVVKAVQTFQARVVDDE